MERIKYTILKIKYKITPNYSSHYNILKMIKMKNTMMQTKFRSIPFLFPRPPPRTLCRSLPFKPLTPQKRRAAASPITIVFAHLVPCSKKWICILISYLIELWIHYQRSDRIQSEQIPSTIRNTFNQQNRILTQINLNSRSNCNNKKTMKR